MPIQKKWSKLTPDNIKKLGNERGAYELANKQKKTIDIGGSDGKGGIRSRLESRRREGKPPTATHFRAEKAGMFEIGISLEAKHSAKYQEKEGRKPRYTERSPKKKGLFSF